MIVNKLFAGLGNQCFMIAACIAHAKKMNTSFAVPKMTINNRLWKTYFNHLPVYKGSTKNQYKEAEHYYQPLPELDDLTIEGYFQTELYFQNAKPEIQKALQFERSPNGFTGLHIRRGDYLRFPNQFPTMDLDYYFRAIDIAVSKGHTNFKVYSDDLHFCRQLFGRSEFYGRSICYSETRNPVVDMKDLYNCNGFIIANSTFSLFPALLRDDNPMVIAPHEGRWYGPMNKLSPKDLMPERFIKI